jgi:hypothetical protein
MVDDLDAFAYEDELHADAAQGKHAILTMHKIFGPCDPSHLALDKKDGIFYPLQ